MEHPDEDHSSNTTGFNTIQQSVNDRINSDEQEALNSSNDRFLRNELHKFASNVGRGTPGTNNRRNIVHTQDMINDPSNRVKSASVGNESTEFFE